MARRSEKTQFNPPPGYVEVPGLFTRYPQVCTTTVCNLINLHTQTCSKALELMKCKNHDYSGTENTTDGLKNFRAVEEMGLASTEVGIAVRLTDKYKRLMNFLVQDKLMVKSESVDDTIIDMINYLIILQAVLNERRSIVQDQKDSAL
jgi:hypothetical protein